MKINLLNLHEDVNKLQLCIDPANLDFDENKEALLLFDDNINADIEVQKFSDKYFIKVGLATNVHFTCDRCLDDYHHYLQGSFQLIYSKEVARPSDDDDYRLLSDKAFEIDLSHDIRENLLLLMPMKSLCKEHCSGLCSICGVNLNYETCNCKVASIDPRWEKLKNIKV